MLNIIHGEPGFPRSLAFSQQFGGGGLNRLTSGGYSRNVSYHAYGDMAVQADTLNRSASVQYE